MGKASRRKHAEEQQRLYFDIKGDARSAEDRAKARAMLDKLQKKLDDDALREDGFYFLDGKYTDARRSRFTPGMKTQSYTGHKRKITSVAVVTMEEEDIPATKDLNSWVVTFAADSVRVWNMKTGELLGALDLSLRLAVHVCGAATRQPLSTGASAKALWIAFATHHEPSALAFDVETRQFPAQEAATASNESLVCVGHQQQIEYMAFNHSGARLVTGSMDSTCILWSVDAESPIRLGLTILYMIPGADSGVVGCGFAYDDQELVSVGGDGTVKVWRVDSDDTQSSFQQKLRQWNEAEPFSLSFARTMDLMLFDDGLPSHHLNDDWVLHSHRHNFRKTDALALPTPLDTSSTSDSTSYSTIFTFATSAIESTGKAATPAIRTATQSSENPSTRRLDANRGEGGFEDQAPQARQQQTDVIVEETISEIEILRREYEKIEHFDFEMLLNPAAPLLRVNSTDNQSTEQLHSHWPVLTPDADGRLIRCFQPRKPNGDFAAHTSRVTGFAIAKEDDLVVTVSNDKSVICWAISDGLVCSITRNAHASPITSCALTSPTHSRPKDLELLLATAAKDNLIKVWRFLSPDTRELQCVYMLTGHFDAIAALRFDASGVFLISSGDDTLAHCWRVRPAPPDAPTKPEVLAIDRFAITIQWRVPLANGSALTKYVVHTEQLTCFAEDRSDMKQIKDLDVAVKYKTVTLDNLQPGIQYRLCVAAVNGVGQSLWSDTTDTVETLAFAPSKIEKPVQYREITANSIRLSWKAPCANGAVITTYTVRCLPENAMFVPVLDVQALENELIIVSPEPTDGRRRVAAAKSKLKKALPTKADTGPPVYEYIVQGLWPGEVYQFIVAAENRCGLADFSPFSDYIKMESTAPDAPAQPIIASVGKRHADISWVKPRSNGSEILQYIVDWIQSDTVEVDPANRLSVTLLTKTILGTTYRITGLKPGRPLRVRVAATNLVNGKLTASPFSEPSEAVSSLCDVPDLPVKPQLVAPTAHSIVVVVYLACDNGEPIKEYQIALFCEEIQFGIVSKRLVREFVLAPENFEATPLTEQDSTVGQVSQLSFTVYKLRARSFYSATVVAVNALGSSPVSDCSAAVSTKPPTVPATISEPPLIEGIEPTRAKISWKMPIHDGGAPLASFVLQYSINDGACDSEIVLFQGKELVLEHLKPKTSYAFRVTSTNAVGRGMFSPPSASFTTPSLVEFTISTYFASRPHLEHAKAKVLQTAPIPTMETPYPRTRRVLGPAHEAARNELAYSSRTISSEDRDDEAIVLHLRRRIRLAGGDRKRYGHGSTAAGNLQ